MLTVDACLQKLVTDGPRDGVVESHQPLWLIGVAHEPLDVPKSLEKAINHGYIGLHPHHVENRKFTADFKLSSGVSKVRRVR